MNILLAGQTSLRKDNGQAVFTIRLAEGLAKIGHNVLMLLPSWDRIHYFHRYNNVFLQTVPSLHLGYTLSLTWFYRNLVEKVIEQFCPDIIHIQDHFSLSRIVLKIAKEHKIPIVATNHFLPSNWSENLRVPKFMQGCVHKLMWNQMVKFFNHLDAITAQTQIASDILYNHGIGVPTRVISCGIDLNEFQLHNKLDKVSSRKYFQLVTDQPIFLYLGRLDRDKGIEELIEAAQLLQDYRFQIALAGDGFYRNSFQRKSCRLGLEKHIVFLNYINSEDLPLLFSIADAFIMPGHAELQSIATLEAMSCGLPVLASDAYALPELVDNGVNGYLFKQGNALDIAEKIKFFLSEPERWTTMGQISLQKSHDHCIVDTIDKYVSWYRNIVTKSISIKNDRSTPESVKSNKSSDKIW